MINCTFFRVLGDCRRIGELGVLGFFRIVGKIFRVGKNLNGSKFFLVIWVRIELKYFFYRSKKMRNVNCKTFVIYLG